MPSVGASLRNVGAYNASTAYNINDLVQYLGSTYAAVAPTTGNLPTNTSYWALFVGSGQGVPTGGTSGQVLTKSSAANYDTAWATASGGTSSSGAFYPWATATRTFIGPPLTATPVSASPAFQQQYAAFYPVRIPAACTIASVSVIQTAANYTSFAAFLGLYTDVGPIPNSGGPGVRLASGSALLQATAYTPTTVNMSSLVISAPTNIWVYWGCTSATASFMCHAAYPMSMAMSGASGFASSAGAVFTGRYNTNFAYSSQPADVTSTSGSTPFATSVPVFLFTLAA